MFTQKAVIQDHAVICCYSVTANFGMSLLHKLLNKYPVSGRNEEEEGKTISRCFRAADSVTKYFSMVLKSPMICRPQILQNLLYFEIKIHYEKVKNVASVSPKMFQKRTVDFCDIPKKP